METPPSKPRSPELKLLIAIGLGPATLVISPLVALITLIPFMILARHAPSKTMEFLGRLVQVKDMWDFLSVAFGLVTVYLVLGIGVTAMLSWYLTRSWKHGLLTLAFAGVVQAVSIATALMPLGHAESPVALADPDSVFQTYARLEDLRVEIREPYLKFWGNPHPEYGTAYQWARVHVSVMVSREGLYGIDSHYAFKTSQVSGSSPWKSAKVHLKPGRHVVPLEFRHNEIGSAYAFWDTTFVGGTAMARLSYFASEQELLDAVGRDPGFEEYLRENNEDGTIGTEPNSERSIGTMEARFEPRANPIAVAPEAPRDYQFPMGPADAVLLSISRTEGDGSTTYRYSLENRSGEALFSFMIGAVRSSPSCPELRSVPVGYVESAGECPGSIVIRRKWVGCAAKWDDCDGYFLNFGYPDGEGLLPGKTLNFTVTVPAPDSTYEHASFWIVGQRSQYEGRTHPPSSSKRAQPDRME